MTTHSVRSQVPVAVVGLGAICPGSTDAQGFWRDILAGKDLITDVPPSHWLIEDYYDPNPSAPDKTYAKRGAFLPDVAFDPMEFGIPPSIVPATDTAQLLALIVAQKVLEDASQGQFQSMDRERMSVILGVTSGQELLSSMSSRLQRPVWLKALRDSGIPEDEAQAVCDRISKSYVPWQEATFPGLLGNVVAGRIANRFDLRGTNCVTDAACASALSALSMAVNELALGQSDVVITGGVDTMNDIFMYMCFSKTPALSASGDCRPFSDAADGTMLGEGLVMLALKRLDDAERDGDRVYAVIRGLGSASDGRAKSVYAPLPEGQARALRRAYETAGYGADTVEFVEAHGTGTKAGDVAEFGGLQLAFDESGRKDRQWCALGSVKSQIGHTKSAAGAAGMFKAVLALHHKVLPPTIKIDRPNPKLAVEESPFYLNTRTRPWIRDHAHPRRASVSSFGFGGSNFHVALEEYTGDAKHTAWRTRTAPTELVTLSAASASELVAAARALAAETPAIQVIARDSQASFRADHAHRLGVIATDATDLAQKLTAAAAMIERAPDAGFSTPTGTHYGVGARAGELAMLFPGQGSQYVNMGEALAIESDAARAVWDQAASMRFDASAVHDVVFPRPVFTDADREAQAQTLTATEWAQPAIGVASAATFAALRELGIKPDCVAGHSFGEVTALFAAGAIESDGLVRVARRRGELMRDAASVPGAMTAVSAGRAEVEQRLAQWGVDVVVANHNSPTQVVLSGTVEAIADAEHRCAAEGWTAKRLGVATAFHSRLVAPSCEPFKSFLNEVPVSATGVTVFANASASEYSNDPADIRQTLSSQIAKPVRFVEMIEAMYARGVRTFLEVGPSAVLTDLVGRILGDRTHTAIATDRKGKHGLTSFQEALARMCAAGVAVDFAPLWRPYAEPSRTPKKKPGLILSLNGSNYGKPYPPPGGAKDLPKPVPSRKPEPVATPMSTPKSPTLITTVPHAPAAHEPPAAHNPPAPHAPVAHAPVAHAPVAHAPVSAAPALSSDVHLAWVHAYQEAQRHTADAHAAYQRAMAESHQSFLRMAESSFAGLSAMLTGQPLAHAPVVHTQHSPHALPAPVPMPVHHAPVVIPPLPAPAPVVHAPLVAMPAPVAPAAPAPVAPAPAPVAPAPAPVAVSAPVAAPAPKPAAPAAPALDLEALMLTVVAEKTGYPSEMLAPHMELEADLGIDSIKRVEILAAIRERAPGMPEVKPNELAQLRTLGQIVDHLRAALGASAPAPKPAAPAAAPVAAPAAAPAPKPAAAAAPALDLEALMLTVVAEKTGYPSEMLAPHMELEADLGIDSIKRVEILAAIRERAPGMPEVKPNELAQLRTLGQIVDHLRAALPSRPLLQAAATMEEAASVKSGVRRDLVQRFAVRAVPAAAVGMCLEGLLTATSVVVTDDGRGLAQAVVAQLAQRGVSATVVAEVPADAGAVIFLGGTRAVASVDQCLAVEREAFRAAKAVAARFSVEGGVFVTVQDTGGDFGLSGADPLRAWLGGIAALARTAALEWTKAQVRAIDLSLDGRSLEASAEALVEELFTGGASLEIALDSRGIRRAIESVLTAAPKPLRAVQPGGVWVVSGGARGVTATSLIALAAKRRPKLVILGRTALTEEPAELRAIADEAGLKRAVLMNAQRTGTKITPAEVGASVSAILGAREVRGTLAALERAGSTVQYVAADVQDAASLAAALDGVRRAWGPITGVVHGAGVLADKRIVDKTEGQFDKVFDVKVGGLRALLDATANDPIDVLCLFSSVAARAGNVGQVDYAMANEVLNAVACAEQRRRGGQCIVRSIGWGPWEGGMVTPSLKAHFQSRGVALIPLDAGAEVFIEECEGAIEDTVIVVGAGTPEQALGAESVRPVALAVRVDAKSHPFLSDHRVETVPVLPVVMALEWFSRAASQAFGAGARFELRAVKVLRGVRLDRFDHQGDRLIVRGRVTEQGLALELRGAHNALHYSAMAVRSDEPPPRALAPLTHAERLDGPLYDGLVLFHGPEFQVIREVSGVSREGITGTLTGLTARGWAGDGWCTDPAVLDGGLQLALLWARHALKGATLPMGIERVRTFRVGAVGGAVRCSLRATGVQSSRAVCEVRFALEDGTPLAEMTGVELILRPDAQPTTSAISS